MNTKLFEGHDHVFSQLNAKDARIAELEEALRFYEDEWETDFSSARRVLACFAPVNPSDNLLADRGEIARTALKEKTPTP